MTATGSRHLAKQMLHRMGETGQPPERGALRVNVGTGETLDLLREEYLLPIREAHLNSTYKLVQAPFGGGKTHFLHCLRETAWREGFVTALVGVSPKECPFDELEGIYQAVARELEAPPQDDMSPAERGIGEILRAEVARRRKQHGDDEIREWLTTELARAPIENLSFRRAAALFMEAVLREDIERETILEEWLRGERVGRREVHPFGVRDELSERNAFSFLKSLIQLLNVLDAGGLLLLFDEIDRVMSLTVRRRRTIADNIREMIDCCGQSRVPGMVFVYAVPPEFMTNLVPEYPALEQRLRGAPLFSRRSPLSPVIDLDRLPIDAEELLWQIGGKLLELHGESYGDVLEAKTQEGNLRLLAREMAASQLESGVRRTFVRCAVALLLEQQHGQQKLLSEAEIRVLSGRKGGLPPELDGEEVF
ncbi:MAG: BREX system ATP-binding domain-containing protein [Planctomycetota bacterium]